MPQPGVSTEFVQCLEDDTATLIAACDHVDRLHTFGRVLYQRAKITLATYRDYRDSCDYVAHALHIARRNTGRLRNGVGG